MRDSFNNDQAKGLATFCFDIAKGLILGGIGFATVSTLEIKIIIIVTSFVIAYTFVQFALSLLKDI